MIETLEKIFTGINKKNDELIPKYYMNVRHDVLSLVPENAKCVLEIGCTFFLLFFFIFALLINEVMFVIIMIIYVPHSFLYDTPNLVHQILY